MPKVEKHAPGAFCWVELATTDQPAAKQFYSEVFGWQAMDRPIGAGETYTLFQKDGGNVAAAYSMRTDERAIAPPHWTPYIAVESADASAKKVLELGGRLVDAPFDVMTAGRMAVVQEPSGAFQCLWEPKENPGLGITHEDGTFCWADLGTPDPEKARAFLAPLFGWEIGPQPNYPPGYLVIHHAGAAIGGIGPREANIPAHWMLFFLSTDVDATAARVEQRGGAIHMGPADMGAARMAMAADPQGARFALIRPPGA